MPERQNIIDDEIGAISLADAQGKKEEEKKDQEMAPVQIPTGLSIVRTAEGYIFSGLKYQNQKIDPVELSASLLDKGATKDLANWKTYSQTNSEKWSVVDTEIVYQMLFSAYQLRNDAKHQAVVSELTAYLQGLLEPYKSYLITLTTFNYHAGTKDATVSKLGTALGTVADKRIEVPEFTKLDKDWSYLILSKERPETELTTVKKIPKKAEPLLETMLGENNQHAGAVFSYFSPRRSRSSKLRESCLWTPTESNRNIGERLAVFGAGSYDDWFNLYAFDIFNVLRPALGVRLR